jgi:hypothetical protein
MLAPSPGAAILGLPEGSLLLRHARGHEQTFQRAYGAMIKGWFQAG